jgi:nucleoside-diphosphate-sugar epimerase
VAKTRALVTGSAGFLGSHLCERLLSEGYRVVSMDNLGTGSLENVAHLKDETHFEYIDHDVTSHINIGGRCWQMGVAEVVDHNVKCSEEGVHIDHEESLFLFLGDRAANRL